MGKGKRLDISKARDGRSQSQGVARVLLAAKLRFYYFQRRRAAKAERERDPYIKSMKWILSFSMTIIFSKTISSTLTKFSPKVN